MNVTAELKPVYSLVVSRHDDVKPFHFKEQSTIRTNSEIIIVKKRSNYPALVCKSQIKLVYLIQADLVVPISLPIASHTSG